MAAADLSSPLCGVWRWEEGIRESDEEAEFLPEAPTEGQVSTGGSLRPLESRAGKGAQDSMRLRCSPFNRQMVTEGPLVAGHGAQARWDTIPAL